MVSPCVIIRFGIVLNQSVFAISALNEVQTAGQLLGVDYTESFHGICRQSEICFQRFFSIRIFRYR